MELTMLLMVWKVSLNEDLVPFQNIARQDKFKVHVTLDISEIVEQTHQMMILRSVL